MVAASCCAFALASLSHLEAENAPDLAPQSDFAIMNWGAAPTTEAALQRMKDCGFNIVGFGGPAELDDRVLSLCNDLELQAFIWPTPDQLDAVSSDTAVGGNPAVRGFVVGSEFPISQFPEMAKGIQTVLQNQPEKVPLICLFPPYAALEHLGFEAAQDILGKEGAEHSAQNYQTYLDRFVEECKPAMLSYDAYALMENGSLNPVFWTCLETFRKKTLEAKIPFWNVIQAVAHMQYREPSAADFRFQAYASAAYGAKGLVYFSYKAYPYGNYRDAAVDQWGNETPTWQRIQNTNSQINGLAPTLMKLRSDLVYHIGSVPEGSEGPSPKSLVQSIAGDFLVGDFTHEDGSRYVMLVNKDLTKSEIAWPKFRDSYLEGEIVSMFNGQLQPLRYEDRWLAPGQGLLLKVEKKK